MKALLVLTLVLSTSAVFARSLKVKVTLSPAGDFTAQSEKVRGFVEKNGGKLTADELTIEVGTLKTGIDLRDQHFQERLGGAKAKIVVKNASGTGGKGTGTLVVNGKTKPIAFIYKEAASKVIARFAVKPSDFGISGVKYMGIGVEDKVIVDAEIPLR